MGLFPLVVCGAGNTQNNWIQRMFEIPGPGPFGGNFSVSVWTLGVLYEQWLLHHNVWSRRNDDLDLVKYKYFKLRFWRHPDVDYVVSYDRNTPYRTQEYSHAMCHPLVLLLSRKKIVIPSYKTKPRGKPYKTAKIKPPRMLTHKFYFQQDFCNVPLFILRVSACRLGTPWINPKSISPCFTFYGLKNSVYTDQSITATASTENNYKELFSNSFYIYTANSTLPSLWRRYGETVTSKKAVYSISQLKEKNKEAITKLKELMEED